jgi:RecA-family ATPase
LSAPLAPPHLNILTRYLWYTDRLREAGVPFDPDWPIEGLTELYRDHYETASENKLPVVKDDNADEVYLSTVTPRNVDWHWRPYVQVSAFHLLAGEGGAGKGSWLALVTAAMSRGVSEYLTEPRNVIIVASEDSAEVDLVPRILAAGGDLSRVIMLTKTILLPRDIEYLEEKIARERNGAPTGAVIIDPVANHIGGKSTDDEGSVREAINELNHVADRTGCAIFGVRHITKYGDGGVKSVLGSGAWTNSPRVVLMMKQSVHVPYDVDDRALEVVKSNRGKKGERREYRIHRVEVDGVTDLIPRLERSEDWVPRDQP